MSSKAGCVDKWVGYAQAKTAVIPHSIKLAKLFEREGINVFSFHLGSIRCTTMGSAPSVEESRVFGPMDKDGNPTSPDIFDDLETSTATVV